MKKLTEGKVQCEMISWFYAPGWYVRKLPSEDAEKQWIAATMSDYYIDLSAERVTAAEFEYAAACARKRLRKFPTLADLLDYVQEYRSRSPVQPPLALPVPEGSECRDFARKISVQMLSKIGRIAENLPKNEHLKLWAWWHGVAAEGVEEVLDRLAAGELSVDQLTVL